ncbi:MAG: hypothetical protein JJ969_06270 [Rhizobiaceae bacterium]|nr:hypothetical protein [Rhizobiaceae bacterium]
MDWTPAIKRNRGALERVLAALFALAGLETGQSAMGSRPSGSDSKPVGVGAVSDYRLPTAHCPLFLPRHLHSHVLRLLRAAESAIRRLIVIAAREAGSRSAGKLPNFAALRDRNGPAGADTPIRIPAFPLLDPPTRFSFDPPRRASKFFPRIGVAGITEPAPIPEKPIHFPDDPVSATALCRRLLSSRRALANLPREARRLARWTARNRLRSGPARISPLRIGYPPGRRKHSTHAVDDILRECQTLALDVLDPPDTS